MIRATTPIHVFSFPEDPASYDVILITYKQGSVILEKNKDDLTIDSDAKTATVILTQSETAQFSGGYVQIQVRVAFANGVSYASSIIVEPVDTVLDDTILPIVPDEGEEP